MFENIGQILVLAVAAGLMIFSASGTISLLSPGLGDAAYFALLAFDGGVIAWLMTFLHGAKGGPQRAIAALMIVIDLLGCIVGFGVNLIMTFGKIGEVAKLDQSTTFTALLAVVFVIAANIAATVFFHLLSIENRKRMAEEGLHDAIDRAANKKAKAAIPDLADRLAEMMTDSQMQQLESHYRATVTASSAKRPALQAPRQITAKVVTEQPSRIDEIKQRLSEALYKPSDEMTTLASDGATEVVAVPKAVGD